MQRMAPVHPAHETRDFVFGMVVGVIAMILTIGGTLYELGYFGSDVVNESRPVEVVEEAAPRPTPVWRFRQEWLTPASGR